MSRSTYFIDTNVLVDLILNSEPFYEYSKKIFSLAETGRINIKISVLTFSTLFYLCRKIYSVEVIQSISKKIRSICTVVPFNEKSLAWAESAGFPDLEDAIQNHIAQSSGCTTILTRNKKDFKKSKLAILTPEEFLISIS